MTKRQINVVHPRFGLNPQARTQPRMNLSSNRGRNLAPMICFGGSRLFEPRTALIAGLALALPAGFAEREFDREAAQQHQRGVARAEVVDREAQAEGLQRAQRVEHGGVLLQAGGSALSARLVIAADGSRSLAREAAELLNVPVLDLMAHFPPPDKLPPRPPLTQAVIYLIGECSSSGWSDYETERQRGGYTFTFDGLHLTPEAAKKMAAIIVDFLDF